MHISILNGTDETLYEFNKSYELKGVNTIKLLCTILVSLMDLS